MTASVFTPDPDKAAELVQILLARNGRQRGDELTYQCFYGERHKNGDVHTSASYNVVKHAGNCRACGATYGFVDLAKLAGLDLSRQRDTPREPITLAQYAEQKHLDPELLAAEGVVDALWLDGIPAVWIPAPGIDGTQDGAGQFRVRRRGPDHLRSAKGQQQRPYGLHRLAAAREAGYVFIVEGPTDALTLWQYGEPAIGLPVASPGHGILSQLPAWLEGIELLYVVKEPDAGGNSLVPALDGTSVRDHLRVVDPAPYKDVNAAHVADPAGFRDYFFAALCAATEIPPATKAQDARDEEAEGNDTHPDAALRMTSWREVEAAALTEPPLELVKDMLVAGDTLMLHGFTGAKKSLSVLEMAIAIEREIPYLGHFQTRRAHVGIIDQESGSEHRLGTRLPLLRRGHEIAEDDDRLPLFKVTSGVRLDTDEGIAWLFDVIRVNRLDVIVFDTLLRTHRKDENDSSDMAVLFEQMRGLKLRVRAELGRDLTVVLIHHAPKPRMLGNNSAETMARGSGDLLGQVDAGLYLRKGEGEQVIVECSKMRWGPEFPKFAVNTESGPDWLRLVYAGGVVEAESKAQAAERFVLEALAEGTALFRQELIDRAIVKKIGKRTADEVLKALKAAGKITPEMVGARVRYRLTETGEVT